MEWKPGPPKSPKTVPLPRRFRCRHVTSGDGSGAMTASESCVAEFPDGDTYSFDLDDSKDAGIEITEWIDEEPSK